MKITLIIGATIVVCGLSIQAETNNTAGQVQPNLMGAMPASVPPQVQSGVGQIWDAASNPTNFAIAFGGGRSTHRNYNLVFVDYVYDIVRAENGTAAGFILGFDDIAHCSKFTTDSIAFVKGGVNLQMEVYPLKNFGYPNFHVTPYTSLLVADSGSHVGSIELVGVNWRANLARGWYINLGGFYESRNGTGQDTDTTYLCVDGAVSKGF